MVTLFSLFLHSRHGEGDEHPLKSIPKEQLLIVLLPPHPLLVFFISLHSFIFSASLPALYLFHASCCSSPELLTHCLVPPLLSLQHLPLSRLYFPSLDHYLRGLSVLFPYLQAGRDGAVSFMRGSYLWADTLTLTSPGSSIFMCDVPYLHW